MADLNIGIAMIQVAFTTPVALASVLGLWIRHRTTVAVEKERTERLVLALSEVEQSERAKIIEACGELEAGIHDRAAVPSGRRRR